MISRVEKSGALVLNKEAFNIKALVDELIPGISLRSQQKQQKIDVVVDPDLVIVADRDRLTRAISNLLDNAVKFTPIAGQITLKIRREMNIVAAEVSDNGDGMARKDLPKVFERFYRADKARKRDGGAEVGLAIVKTIVEAHGGEVIVQSTEAHGSTFIIRIPT